MTNRLELLFNCFNHWEQHYVWKNQLWIINFNYCKFLRRNANKEIKLVASNSSVFLTHTRGSGWKKKVEYILWQPYQSNIRLLVSTYPQATKWKKPAIILRVFVQISPPSLFVSARRAVAVELPGHWQECNLPHLMWLEQRMSQQSLVFVGRSHLFPFSLLCRIHKT